ILPCVYATISCFWVSATRNGVTAPPDQRHAARLALTDEQIGGNPDHGRTVVPAATAERYRCDWGSHPSPGGGWSERPQAGSTAWRRFKSCCPDHPKA